MTELGNATAEASESGNAELGHPEARERIWEFADGFAKASGLEATARIARNEADGMTISFDGPDARLLVGHKGRVLDAFQAIAQSIIGRGVRLHVLFDADGYREHREQILTQLAHELADDVEKSGQEAELEPLSPLERRIIHKVLQERPAVRTYSEGEEPDRYIVIAPAH